MIFCRLFSGIGIYEPGITYKQMKRLLEFVNESQDTSNIISNNKNIQEVCNYNDSHTYDTYYMHATLKYVRHKIFDVMIVMK